MNIGIIDADLIGRAKHRFPNLACMKISGYYKAQGYNVNLLLNYDNLEQYDKVYISKVFTDTPIDEDILKINNVKWGGTGFFYDKAEPLPYEIEHHMPDYHLYDDWVNTAISLKLAKIEKRKQRPLDAKEIKKAKEEYEYYTDFSIGYTTRGCFRKCDFCVNKKYNKVELHSPLEEFVDSSRKYICLLDDNILGYHGWKDIINQLKNTGKPFQYKQGMDERLLTEEKVQILSSCKYKGDYIFAFDNIADKELIISKLELWRKYCKKQLNFMCFVVLIEMINGIKIFGDKI